MSSIENVVIAAAGMGTRLGAGKPKCLVDICGRKLIEYQLDMLREIKNIYVVVGFCEWDVIDFICRIRSDVIFVRNPDFQHTKTLESYYLAAKVIRGNAVFMDGDMIVSTKDFYDFTNKALKADVLVGVSKRITDDPVYADVREENGALYIHGFSYNKESNYEWANVVYMPAELMKGGKMNAFEHIQTLLPTRASVLDRLEIDTCADLKYAISEINSDRFCI